MGNSQASAANVANVIEQAITNVINSTTQNSSNTATNNVYITASASGGGNINYDNNNITQTGNLNMTAVISALGTQTAQTQLTANLSQSTAALISGLEVGSANASASNIANVFSSAVTNLTNNIKTSCANVSTNNIGLNFTTTGGGGINIEGNSFDQLNEAMAKCTESASTVQSASTSIATTLQQTAVAKVTGLSLNGLIIIIIVILVIVGVVVIIVLKTVQNVINIVLTMAFAIMGGVFLWLYLAKPTKIFQEVIYSNTLNPQPISPATGAPVCNATNPSAPNYTYATPQLAINACVNAPTTCQGVDWVPPTSGETNGTTTFWGKIGNPSNSCLTALTKAISDETKYVGPNFIGSANITQVTTPSGSPTDYVCSSTLTTGCITPCNPGTCTSTCVSCTSTSCAGTGCVPPTGAVTCLNSNGGDLAIDTTSGNIFKYTGTGWPQAPMPGINIRTSVQAINPAITDTTPIQYFPAGIGGAVPACPYKASGTVFNGIAVVWNNGNLELFDQTAGGCPAFNATTNTTSSPPTATIFIGSVVNSCAFDQTPTTAVNVEHKSHLWFALSIICFIAFGFFMVLALRGHSQGKAAAAEGKK
jgi:hypothetical protein